MKKERKGILKTRKKLMKNENKKVQNKDFAILKDRLLMDPITLALAVKDAFSNPACKFSHLRKCQIS